MNIKLLLPVVLIFPAFGTFSQTNLVANGSFEEFVPFGSEELLPSTFLYSEFISDNISFLNKYQQLEENPGANLHYIVHHLNCWETYDFDPPFFEQDPYYNKSSIIVLSSNQGTVYLANPNGVFPFGIPYENDFTVLNCFGSGQNILSANTVASHSDSYVALITHRWIALDTCEAPEPLPSLDMQDPRISATLIEELVPNKEYTFKIDVQKIAHLNSFCPGDPFSEDDDENPKIKVVVYKSSNPSIKKNIFLPGWETIDHTTWQTYTGTFHVNSAGYDRIEIRVDRETGQNEGVFIDNVQLYDACQVPETVCENPALFDPLLNIEIEKIEQELPATGGGTYELKTVHVHDLNVANYIKIVIANPGATEFYRTIEMENPPNDIMWDGKNDAGEVMPDGIYRCSIEASNLCYSHLDTKLFKKESEIHLFEPTIAVNDFGGVTISGLEEASYVAVTVEHYPTDISIFFGIVGMPENEIGWNGSAGNHVLQYQSPQFTETGYYRIRVAIQSKCGVEEFQEIVFIDDFQLIQSYINGNYADPLYQWFPVPDKIVPDCDYFTFGEPFYRVPKNCCVGDLFLDDEYLWGDMTFNILGTIHINSNVTFAPGSEIVMYAGEGFEIKPFPDGSEFVIASNVHLKDTVICDPCDCNKSMEGDPDTTLFGAFELVEPINEQEETVAESIKVSPNPASDYILISIPPTKTYTRYTLYNVKGEVMMSDAVLSRQFMIDVSGLAVGDYIIRFTNGVETESFKVVVN
jgi:hypothetical protein